ncbi:MAG: TetR/AcrR family transcriptional regulator [Deltaproteobacteria bacterium]|nr:TetR/AcrR family transcriptional regulator [Deltaproteobacteria bacterium]
MARSRKFSRKDIIDAAFLVVREKGLAGLTARAVAQALDASTMPVYSHVKTMSELGEAVVRKAWDVLAQIQEESPSGDIYIDMGLGYVLFAKREPMLFACIHSEEYSAINTGCGEVNFEANLKRLMAARHPMFEGVDEETARKVMFYGWLFAHGFASLLTSGIGNEARRLESESATIDMFKSANKIFFHGLKSILKQPSPKGSDSERIQPDASDTI